MKQHTTHNDEALYQQFLTELKPGADEYDRLVTTLTAPPTVISPPHRPLRLWRYAAAACIALAVGLSLPFLMNKEQNKPKPITEAKRPETIAPTTAPAAITAQEQHEVHATPSQADKKETKKSTVRKTKTAEPPPTPTVDPQVLQALLSEVCYRALAEKERNERIHRALCEEITANITNPSNMIALSL
ncbi:MAG: hypothetical protein HUK00_02735 [Bacteroidaceae bacterium]|nr:hypothetical protein [Bacteroidaceae bacterium]